MSLLAVAGKELRDILREKSIVVALLVQFFIAAFSAFLTVGLLGLYDPGSIASHPPADVAYTGPGGFDAILRGAPNLHLAVNASDAVQAFGSGRFDAVVQETVMDGVHTITLLVPEGELKSTLLVTQFRDLLQAYERELRQAGQGSLQHRLLELPATVRQGVVPYPFVYATLLPLLFLTPVFLSGAVAGDAFSSEIQNRTLLLLRSAPLSVPRILLGKMLVPLLLAPAQFLLWAGLLALNGLPTGNLPLLVLLSLALTLLLCSLGFALAARLRREGPTQAAYALVALLLSVGSLFLPRDVLNLIARLGTGDVDGTALLTLGLLCAGALAACVLGLRDAAKRIRRDLV
ncbi:MAG: type transport system permease protein [Thermoplasmata archaeon]|jgi:ABC-type Na+ efflux pump permease subunit|nr:type transport system permease protein [Thermoplasmata archaeon]